MSGGELAPSLRSRDHYLAGGEISGNIGQQRKAKSGGPGKTRGGHCSGTKWTLIMRNCDETCVWRN